MKVTGNTIKAELAKELGINKNHVSVSVKRRGTIDVTIKSWEVSKSKVAQYLNKYSKVQYCEASGEILSGANTFVFVEYFYKLDLPEAAQKRFLELNSWNNDPVRVCRKDLETLLKEFPEFSNLEEDDIAGKCFEIHNLEWSRKQRAA